MWTITSTNAEEYLRFHDRVGDGPVHVEALSGGVSNVVLRVDAGGEPFVVKQSRPQLRTRDAWFSDMDRIYREQEVMEALLELLPPLTVPHVLFVDRENFVFAMSHAPAGATAWKDALLAGDIDVPMGAWAGRVLGMMHEASARDAAKFDRFRDRNVFVQLRVEPFYRRIQERRPEVAAKVQPLIDGMMTRQDALCHGDYTPKNMLVHDRGFMLVDYETAHFGDPAMDLGLFLTHVLLKAFRRPELRDDYFEVMESFWRSYTKEISFRPIAEMETRGVAHWGACLLARIDGTSPVDYLPHEPKRELVRQLGRTILHDGLTKSAEVFDWCRRNLVTRSSGQDS